MSGADHGTPPVWDKVWCDGEIVPVTEATVSCFDRTLLYGLGAFETVRVHGGVPFLLDRHLVRLERSLTAVGLEPPPAVAGLADGVGALAAALDRRSCVCRITVTAGAGGELPGGAPRVLAQLRAVPPPPRRPVVVGIAPVVADPGSPLSGVKSTNYLLHYLLRERAEEAGRLDDLLVDATGCVLEATVSNVFAVRAGRLLTPPTEEGPLPGIIRGVVLELAGELDVPVDQAPLRVADLASVDEFFLTGSAKGLVAVDELAGRSLSAERSVSGALGSALSARVARACGLADDEPAF